MRRSRRTLIIMAKQPRLGRVKTRLGADIGAARATAFYRHALARTLRVLGHDRRWRTVVAVAPDGWRPPTLPALPQGRGDLGARMRRAVNACLPGRAVLVGADIPALSPLHIARAFRLLERHPFVLGPARDGGYWLIGARIPVPPLAPVRWSSAHALADTAALLPGVALADTLDDVDTGADLHRLRG